MENCIFCKIVAGTLPSYRLYEDDNYLAFLNIYPSSKGHTLVIPKKHYQWVDDVPDFGAYWNVARKVSGGLRQVLKPFFITYHTHGLLVEHSHIHIMPRDKNQTALSQDIMKVSKEELESIASEVRKVLKQ